MSLTTSRERSGTSRTSRGAKPGKNRKPRKPDRRTIVPERDRRKPSSPDLVQAELDWRFEGPWELDRL